MKGTHLQAKKHRCTQVDQAAHVAVLGADVREKFNTREGFQEAQARQVNARLRRDADLHVAGVSSAHHLS